MEHFILSVRPEGIMPAAQPGQFFMLGIPGRLDPLLKRPFGYFRVKEDALEFLYRLRGKATAIMSVLDAGDEVEIIGPLGEPYPLPKPKKVPLLVAGGTGIASLYPLADAFGGEALILYGGRNSDELLLTEELRGICRVLGLATEDGSVGVKGTVIDLLKEFLAGKNKNRHVVYACGPRGMLKAVSELGLEGYVSVEERMACGIGVCLGCAVKTSTGHKRACKEGPVFRIGEVVFE